METVWQIPQTVDRKPGHYNASIGFPSAEFAVIADGAGMLHILTRLLEPWQVRQFINCVCMCVFVPLNVKLVII